MRNAREDRPQSKNDTVPGGIAARLNKPKADRGAEAAKAVWLALPDTAFDDGATQQRSCGRRQDARTANMAESEGKPWHATDSIRALHFWGGGPRKCGVLRRARAGDGPGAKLLPAADYDRAGQTDDGDSKRLRRT